jgi:DNA-binding IclR family transcriptional regulator
MELSKSTIYGLVNTLVAKGYLEQNVQTKRYRLGIKLFEFGTLVLKRMDLRNEAKPFCEELVSKHNATVHLAAHYGDEIVYIDKVDAPGAMIVYSQTGKRAPMHCTGVGKAILAFLSDDEMIRFLAKGDLQKYTEHTITDPEELYRELRRVRTCGYAVDNEEIETGLRCVAAPIFNHLNQPVAAISVSAPTVRLPLEQIEAIADDVQYHALQISQRLGYK